MNTYQRNGKSVNEGSGADLEANPDAQQQNQGIRVNGMQQVVDMLRAADPEFRESLLRRMAAQEPDLVKKIRRQL